MTQALTIGSLFSGIGGFELGLERAGCGPVIWQAEPDPFCRKVLRKHWPDVKRYRDVREVNEHAERPGILCGGFPCQDISLAGNNAGIDASGLWDEYARIIRLLRPGFVVVENVAALRLRGLCKVVRDLAACGYDAIWDCIPACAVGASHQRDRIFILAWQSLAVAGSVGSQRFILAGPASPDAVRTGDVADSDARGFEAFGVARRTGSSREQVQRGAHADGRHLPDWPPFPDDVQAWARLPADRQPAICRMADGVSYRVDRLRALGNAIVPAVAEVIGRALIARAQVQP